MLDKSDAEVLANLSAGFAIAFVTLVETLEKNGLPKGAVLSALKEHAEAADAIPLPLDEVSGIPINAIINGLQRKRPAAP